MNATSPETASTQIRVLLICPQTILRAGLRALLSEHPGIAVIHDAASCGDALDRPCESPDVVLLAPRLHSETGRIADLLASLGTARLLVLLQDSDSAAHYQAIRMGAMGAVLAEDPPQVLIKAIEKIHAGEAWFDRCTVAELLHEIARSENGRPANVSASPLDELTPREREVVTLVAKGYRNKQVADQLFISEVTVRHHLTSVFSKLGVSDRLGLIVFAFRNNLTDPKS